MSVAESIQPIVYSTFVRNLHSLIASAIAIRCELELESEPRLSIDQHRDALEQLIRRASYQLPESLIDDCEQHRDLTSLSAFLAGAQATLRDALSTLAAVPRDGDAKDAGMLFRTVADGINTAAHELQSALDQLVESAPKDLDREGTAEKIELFPFSERQT